MNLIALVYTLIVVSPFKNLEPPSVNFHSKDAVVWLPDQKIKGNLSGFTAEEVILHHNEETALVKVNENNIFIINITLRDKKNKIWIEVPGVPNVVSDTLHYELGYKPLPVFKPYAEIKEEVAILSGEVIENPYNLPLKYYWIADPLNPQDSKVNDNTSLIAKVKVPKTPGEYNYNVAVISGLDSTWFQTKIIREEDNLRYFDIDTAYPSWMDNAVIYQITPHSFVKNGTFEDITKKLDEIKELGINTLWLQPIFGTARGGQGYDITDYFNINPKFGNEEELKTLIKTAQELGIRVLFDVVLNHSSIDHPFAKDRVKYGKKSHYFDFYQHQDDGKPYSSFYTKDDQGFINYFWDNLVNLNYNHPEVQQWMLESCKYWVREYNIDGYRFDAIWGVNSRNPLFSKRLRDELKSIKPDLLMLAEDKGSLPEVYALGYDAAYDWTTDTTWVSQWSWEHKYVPRESHTIFSITDEIERKNTLREALFNNGGNAHRKLYFMENNDLPGFIVEHGLERTKMVGALMFSLPGIPMLYNGQEIGFQGHPYSTKEFFKTDKTIKSLDEVGLFKYYQEIIHHHNKYQAISSSINIKEIPVSNPNVIAFQRWKDGENFIIVINLDSSPTSTNINFQEFLKNNNLTPGKYSLEDVLSGTKVIMDDLNTSLSLDAFSVGWYLVTGNNPH